MFGPLPLDNPGTGPRSLGDVVRVHLLLWTVEATGVNELKMDGRHAIIYLRRANDFAISRLHKGAARSAKNCSGTAVMFLAKLRGLEMLDGRR